MAQVRMDERAERKAVFQMFDTDNSGSIDAGEFATACHSLGLSLSQTEIEVLMDTYDKNDDRVIDFDEFCTMVASLG
jgi:Ca2+-binding EF-hand superfamily protein